MIKLILLVLLSVLSLAANAAQTCADDIIATSGPFTVNTDNTVTDTATGLTWMRCSLGQSGSDCSEGVAKRYTWSAALNEVANNYSGWRLPNIKELNSIVELKCFDPAINTTIFPNTQNNYLSSSPFGIYSHNNSVSVISFYDGNYGLLQKNRSIYVRLVRGGG